MGYEKLTEHGLKVTIQRIAILDFLENTKSHPSAEMVYNHIKKAYPTITLSTVYNTLETFAKHNIVKKVFTLDGKARYDAHLEKHHHLYDLENDTIIDIYDEELNKLISDYLKSKKYTAVEIKDFQIDFVGKMKKQQ